MGRNVASEWLDQILARQQAVRFGGKRAPKGGAWINGRFYRGGLWIPGSELAKAKQDAQQKYEVAKVDNPLVMPAVWSGERKTEAEAKSVRRQAEKRATGAKKTRRQQEKDLAKLEAVAAAAEARAAKKQEYAKRLGDKYLHHSLAARGPFVGASESDRRMAIKAGKMFTDAVASAKSLARAAAEIRKAADEAAEAYWGEDYERYVTAAQAAQAASEATRTRGYDYDNSSVIDDLRSVFAAPARQSWGEFAEDVGEYAGKIWEDISRFV